MSSPRLRLIAWCSSAVLAALPAAGLAQEARLTAALLGRPHFRAIGPAVTGGRIHDVEALPGDPATIYVASATGGLWKTVNDGTTWTPIFDHEAVSTFGDIAIAPSNPAVIWAGTGEQNNRQSSSWGNGVYRSTDAGATWTHLGLDETRHIGRIVVDPGNPDVAYVAALGNLWKPGPARGVFKTSDGGRTWSKVLYVDTLTGAVDLVMDPRHPRVLYAATYQRLRRAWGFNGGGPGSGIYKTTDGGATWRRLTAGLPAAPIGRIGLAIAASNPSILEATIEHRSAGGTYRSADGGARWQRMSPLNPRPMYYSQVRIDPRNDRCVYLLATESYISEDGGATFRELPTAPTYDVGVHSDFHALWIDPGNTRHFFLAGDGGLYETWDRGATYRKINNIPIAQAYDVGVDLRAPYDVYAGLQDNHSWMGPSATRHWIGIVNDDWREIGFSDGAYQQPDPTNDRYIYSNSTGGGFTRVDGRTGDILDIRPYAPAGEPAYRWDWISPTLISSHDPKVVYAGGNRLFSSRDRGLHWQRTDDLTRQIDRDTLTLMGVRGSDFMLSKHDGESSFGEITTIAESPLDAAILWVGTDDGNVQVSRDGGSTWTEVSGNIPGVANGTFVSRALASAAGPGIAYVTFDAHRDGDFAPYVFRTSDFGRTWAPLVSGLPGDGSVHAIAEHPANPSLLFLGTEHALFVSTNGGAEWVRFPGNLPATLYDDIVIQPRDNDLVVGTHGRGVFVLDDLTPLVQWSAPVAAAPAYLFPIRPAMIFQFWEDFSYRGHAAYAGENPRFGALLSFYLGSVDTATIAITDSAGTLVRTLGVRGPARVLHRAAWDLRHEPPPVDASGPGEGNSEALPVLPHPIAPRGPFVSPGTYTVTLEANGARASQTVRVMGDTLMPVTPAQYRERETFLLSLLEDQRRVAAAVRRAGAIPGDGDSVAALRRRLGGLRRAIYGLAGELNGRPAARHLRPGGRAERQRCAAGEPLSTD